jgi:hypothetical protein
MGVRAQRWRRKDEMTRMPPMLRSKLQGRQGDDVPRLDREILRNEMGSAVMQAESFFRPCPAETVRVEPPNGNRLQSAVKQT